MNYDFEAPDERTSRREEYRSRKKDPSKEKSDKFLKLLKIQTFLCIIGLAAVFAISKLSPSAYERMKTDYAKITEKNMSIGEIFDRIKSGAQFIFAPSAKENESKPAFEFDDENVGNAVDETGETVAVGVMLEGSGGGDIEEKEAADGTTFAPYKINGSPKMPVKNPRVTSKFGYRTNPVSGKYGFHTGIDLAVPEGSPVSAAFYGAVEETGENDVWGKYVLLKHSDGLETYYCHMSEIYAESGAVIRRGETIGLVGTTGWSTGSHLHFEVRINGIRVDPAILLFPDGYEA